MKTTSYDNDNSQYDPVHVWFHNVNCRGIGSNIGDRVSITSLDLLGVWCWVGITGTIHACDSTAVDLLASNGKSIELSSCVLQR